MESKLSWVNLGRVSDLLRAFLLAFRVTEILDNWSRSTMGIVNNRSG